MGKFTREILYKIVSKVLAPGCSPSNIEVNPSNVSHIPPDTLFVTLLETWIHHPGPRAPLPWLQAPKKTTSFVILTKMEKKDSGESVRVHSMLRISIMLIPLRTPQIMINFIWNI